MNELTQESKQRPKPLLSSNRDISKIVVLKKQNKIVTLKQRNNNQYSTKKMIDCLRLFF